jgi:uncharacterized protein YdeI (YjbR/CyaY-like superfamily)
MAFESTPERLEHLDGAPQAKVYLSRVHTGRQADIVSLLSRTKRSESGKARYTVKQRSTSKNQALV